MASMRLSDIGVLALMAGVLVGATSCGGGSSAVDKSPDELNFSRQSAEDAGIYGARDFILPSETGSGDTETTETGETDTDTTETTPTETTPTEPSPGGYSGYEVVTDETGSISFEAPVEWSQHASGTIGPFQSSLTASPDIEGMLSSWTVPGAFTAISKSLGTYISGAATPELALPTVFGAVSPREALEKDCVGGYRTFLVGSSIADNVFDDTLSDLVDFGLVDWYSNCGGNGTSFIDGAGFSEASGSFVYLQLTLTSEADYEAAANYLSTLELDYARVPEPTSEQMQPELSLP